MLSDSLIVPSPGKAQAQGFRAGSRDGEERDEGCAGRVLTPFFLMLGKAGSGGLGAPGSLRLQGRRGAVPCEAGNVWGAQPVAALDLGRSEGEKQTLTWGRGSR